MENIITDREDWTSSKIVELVQAAAERIEDAHARLKASLGKQPEDPLKLLIVQQTSMVPAILFQQNRMIVTLEQRYGKAFQSVCDSEIKDIVNIAQNIQLTIENCMACATPEAAQALIGDISRLNILQQRISGKMMKVRLN